LIYSLFFYIQDLKEHDKFVRYHSMGAIHREYVRKILYVPHNNSIIASSGDNRNSLIITNINKLKKPYIFRLYKVNKYIKFSYMKKKLLFFFCCS